MRPTMEQLAKINALTLEGNFTDSDVEVFGNLMADGEVTAYFSILSPEILNAFARDAKAGKTALNILHASQEVLPIGRSFDASISNGSLYGMFYIPKNTSSVSVSGEKVDTNDVIEQIKSGVYRATSVEFSTDMSDYVCSICGNCYMSMDCEHIAGREYTEKNDIGVDETKMCYVLVGNSKGRAYLAASSLVVAGAVPRAGFVAIASTEQAASSFAMKTTSVVGDKETTFVFKPKVCHNFIENGLDAACKEGGDMTTVDLEKYTAKVEELSKMTEEMKTLETANANYTAEIETLKTQNTEQTNSITALTAQLESESKSAGNYDILFEDIKKLLVDYGVKAEGSEFDASAIDGFKVEELVPKLSEFFEKFMVLFPGGRVTPGDVGGNTEYVAQLPNSVFK